MFDKKEYMKEWRKNHPEYMKEYRKQWEKDNPEKAKEYSEEWKKNNREKLREYNREWYGDRRRTNLKYNLNNRMRTAIGLSLKGNKAGRRWEELVGYKLKDLIKRLKKTMPKGYAWQDYLKGRLHIDHIVPKSIFNFTKSEHIDFKRCWALKNLQLLPAEENLIKHSKLNRPFQPALQI